MTPWLPPYTTQDLSVRLILCAILAEDLLNELGKGRFCADSAGSRPKDVAHPLTLATPQQLHMPATVERSKSWDALVVPGAPVFNIIFTVCDNVTGEAYPF